MSLVVIADTACYDTDQRWRGPGILHDTARATQRRPRIRALKGRSCLKIMVLKCLQ